MRARHTAGVVLDDLVFGLFLLLMAAWPLVDGAKNSVVMLFLGTVAALELFLWGLIRLGYGGRVPAAAVENRGVVVLLLAWVGFTLLQAVPLLSPSLAVDFRLGGKVPEFMQEARFPLSRDGLETWRGGLFYGACLAMFLLALVLVDRWTRLWMAVITLVGVGIFESLFGLGNYLGGKAVFGWAPIHWSFLMVTGTFKNKNHFANLVLLAAAFPVGLFLSYRPRAARGATARLAAWFDDLLGLRGLLAAVLLLFATAIVLSKSRGALLAGGAALLALLLLRWFRHRTLPGLVWIVGIPLLAALFLGASDIGARFARLGTESGGRLEQWRLSLPMVREEPLFGIGAGAYRSAFAAYKSPDLPPLRYDHVHNDYLELLITQGVAGFLLLGSVVALIFARLVRAYLKTGSRRRQGILLGSLFAMFAMLAHAMVDFPFQIPANAVYFFVTCALGLVAASMKPPGGGPG